MVMGALPYCSILKCWNSQRNSVVTSSHHCLPLMQVHVGLDLANMQEAPRHITRPNSVNSFGYRENPTFLIKKFEF